MDHAATAAAMLEKRERAVNAAFYVYDPSSPRTRTACAKLGFDRIADELAVPITNDSELELRRQKRVDLVSVSVLATWILYLFFFNDFRSARYTFHTPTCHFTVTTFQIMETKRSLMKARTGPLEVARTQAYHVGGDELPPGQLSKCLYSLAFTSYTILRKRFLCHDP